MKILNNPALLLSAILLSGCTSIGAQLANLPTHFDNINVKRDIVFDPENAQKIDIYLPPGGMEKKYDVIVFFYGGRWSSGSKDGYAFVGSAFAKAGYVVAIPDYRKYPDVRFPTFAQDAAAAVAWVSNNIANYGGNPDHIFVTGHSSGAHIGALITADPQYLAAHDKQRDTIKAFAGLAGPYAFIPEEADLKDMFGPPEKYPLMQAPTFIDGNEPPMLLLWGMDDDVVGRFNLEKLANAIRKKNGCGQTRLYKDVDHVWIVGALSWLGQHKASVLDDITAFFNKSLNNTCPNEQGISISN